MDDKASNEVATSLRAAYDLEWIQHTAIQQRSAESMWAAIGELERLRLDVASLEDEQDQAIANGAKLRAERDRLAAINYDNSTEIYRLEQEVKRLAFIQQEFHNIEDVAEIRRLKALLHEPTG